MVEDNSANVVLIVLAVAIMTGMLAQFVLQLVNRIEIMRITTAMTKAIADQKETRAVVGETAERQSIMGLQIDSATVEQFHAAAKMAQRLSEITHSDEDIRLAKEFARRYEDFKARKAARQAERQAETMASQPP